MKRITQSFFIILCILFGGAAFSQIANTTGLPGADLIFYEDMRFLNPSGPSGYIVTESVAPESASGNSAIPVDGLAAGELGYVRPTNNYPAGDAVDNRSARLKGNSASANYDTDVWFVVNSIDLSAYDAGSKFFTFSTRSAFVEDGGTNIDDDTTILYTTGFATGSDPTSVTWTPISTTPVGNSAALGADGVWTTQSIDLSAITCGTEFAIAIRRQSSSSGPSGGAYNSGTNRNGTWNLSDLVYTGSTTTLSTKDKALNNSINVYPNPVKNTITINKLDSSINIEEVVLYDILGNVVYNDKIVNRIDVSNLSRGLYILKLESKKGLIFNKKIILD